MLRTIHSVIRGIFEAGQMDIRDADDYAEPGYSKDSEDLPILFANWNSQSIVETMHIRSGCIFIGESKGWLAEESSWVRWGVPFRTQRVYMGEDTTMPRLSELAEKAGYTIEWMDEWYVCDCGKAFRTTGDSYGWTMHGYIGDGEATCGDCVLEDPSGYLEELEGHARRAVTIEGVDLEAAGYKDVDPENSFQHGLYGGQCASPEKIAETLEAADVSRFVFRIDSVGQFDCRFSCFVHKDEHSAAVAALATGETDGPDPAAAMKAALQDATDKMSRLPDGPGVKYARCNPDGTADVRVVSPQEFINGIRD
jgi:hypothetical protein